MTMKTVYSIVVGIIFMLNCFTTANGQGSEQNCSSQNQNVQDSVVTDFKQFLELFSADSEFQMNHVVFPLKYISVDIEENEEIKLIKRQDWKMLHFKNDSQTQNRDIDAYDQVIEINSDSAKVLIRGIDNGINIDFIFEKKDESWFLIEWGDYSV